MKDVVLNVKLYTVKDAAVRVNRSKATIERWIAAGMPVAAIINDRGTVIRRLIKETDLLAAYRGALTADKTRPRRGDDETPME